VRRHGLGALVGRPTGGNQRGINGGAAGLTPDVTVQPTAADLGAGRDVELEAARQWLRGPHGP
jgi:hypothetical protein